MTIGSQVLALSGSVLWKSERHVAGAITVPV
jgi:hypothetical protein